MNDYYNVNPVCCPYCDNGSLQLVDTTIYTFDRKKSITLPVIKCANCAKFIAIVPIGYNSLETIY